MNTHCNTLEDARQLIDGMTDWEWDFDDDEDDLARFVYKHGKEGRSLHTITAAYLELHGGNPLDYDLEDVDPSDAMAIINSEKS